jgi:asparagine synthase (glutamine-hydrolysing)
MCGILFTNDKNTTIKVFRNALDLLKHRGPDIDPSVYEVRNFKLGHTRLKIVDLDNRSNQPFISDDGRYIMIYNGEIYNYRELIKQFKIPTRTTSDTEVVLKLYILFGPEMLKLLNGMFSIIILDSQTDQVFIARDRLGVKPLYYSEKNGSYFYSSEIAPILDLIKNQEFDEVGIRQYRKLRTFFNGRTIYTSIKMFPAAHFKLNGNISSYWELPLYEKSDPTDDELFNLVKSAVDYRCISDVPVGTYLSGGLDSTIVTLLAKENLGSLHTWTVGFEDENEFEYSYIAAKYIDTIHHKVLVGKEEFVNVAKWMINKRKEPLSVPNEVMLHLMTKAVKQENTVVLSGEGADELFFGYDRIFRWANENVWNIEEFTKLYSYGTNTDYEIVEDAIAPFKYLEKNIHIVSAFFQIAHLHGLLRRLDNATMINSVEARVPFVDYRFVERMAGVSYDYKMKNNIVKNPLKIIFRNKLPDEIIDRKKIGFPVPLEKIVFGSGYNDKGMDNWLNFNLDQLKINQQEFSQVK